MEEDSTLTCIGYLPGWAGPGVDWDSTIVRLAIVGDPVGTLVALVAALGLMRDGHGKGPKI